MRGIITATQLLFPVFLGLLIAAACSGSIPFLLVALLLLSLDVGGGIALQYRLERADAEERRFLTALFARGGEGRQASGGTPPKTPAALFPEVYARLRRDGARVVESPPADDAVSLLSHTCSRMAYAPRQSALLQIKSLLPKEIGGARAIVFSLSYRRGSIGEIAFLLLVLTAAESLRLFTVETDGEGYALCEYDGLAHLNYGAAEPEHVLTKLRAILDPLP